MKYTIEKVHISTIHAGDTVEIDGKLRTACKSNLKRCDFMGITLFGDNYRCGHAPVKKAHIYRAMPNLPKEVVL